MIVILFCLFSDNVHAIQELDYVLIKLSYNERERTSMYTVNFRLTEKMATLCMQQKHQTFVQVQRQQPYQKLMVLHLYYGILKVRI